MVTSEKIVTVRVIATLGTDTASPVCVSQTTLVPHYAS